ncbi:MAG: LysM peptidoglycan-binding domain-containing protein [Planctomycetota bacterium]|jgi:hypothetical protein|nr:LysM peptidoglycan-binding domain-containing protein [Planctomycetota bacterium]
MGRLEKQIIAGALALVGILLSVVVYRGVEQRQEPLTISTPSEWADPGDSEPVGTAKDLLAEAPEKIPAPEVQLEAKARSTEMPSSFAEGTAKPSEAKVANATTTPSLETKAPNPPAKPEATILQLDEKDIWDAEILKYSVRKGDTLGQIALNELGSSKLVHEILVLNEGLEPTQLQVGQLIHLPAIRPLKNPRSVQAPKPAGVLEHAVVAGDSLWSLSQKYRVEGGVNALVEANTLLPDSDTSLQIGWVLKIPTE